MPFECDQQQNNAWNYNGMRSPLREYEEIMENISRYSKEKEKERMGVIQS